MTNSLLILGLGAVTPVGLTAPQTCAAIRAGISAFSEGIPRLPPKEPVVCATIPARQILKRTPQDWFINLAVRALKEAAAAISNVDLEKTAIFIALPDAIREHEALSAQEPINFIRAVESRLNIKFHPKSFAVQEGSAASFKFLMEARELLNDGEVKYCLVGAVDSLVNIKDVEHLEKCARLHQGAANSQGVIPGEGAAFVLLGKATDLRSIKPIANILGIGIGRESDIVTGERYSTGLGLRKALDNTIQDADCKESEIVFRVSDMNGERYRAWESMISTTRFYRTRREHLETWYFASSVGDMGAASGLLGVVVASTGIQKGYAAGNIAMCEAVSDEGLRGGCLVSALG